MDDQERYEDVPRERNRFVSIFVIFGLYVRNIFFDFINSFKYNPMKLPSLLVAAPGIFLGFFLGFHSKVIGPITYDMAWYTSNGERGACSYKIGFDYGGIVLFIMMLLGILNIFGAASMSGKRNLGSVVLCTISTIAIVVLSCLYIYSILIYKEGASTAVRVAGEKVKSGDIDLCYIPGTKKFSTNSNWTWSMISVVVSCVTSVTGCVLGFIFYDRTYEKVDR